MKTLGSLAELEGLLPAAAGTPQKKSGYDGKPQIIRVTSDAKRRKGKTVTLAAGFQSTPDELERLAGKLRKTCGAGGRVLDNEIEIQGDHIQTIRKFLENEGYTVK